MSTKILLASKSPRRRELMLMITPNLEIVDVDVEEILPQDVPCEDVAQRLAELKSTGFPIENIPEGGLLITADTIVVSNGEVLGKPHSREEAKDMLLRKLSGRSHWVYTGVCIVGQGKKHSFTDATEVVFSPLTEEEIEHYLNMGTYSDKAGSYGIQEWIGAIGVEKIKGSYYNVMGLPVNKLWNEMKKEFNIQTS